MDDQQVMIGFRFQMTPDHMQMNVTLVSLVPLTSNSYFLALEEYLRRKRLQAEQAAKQAEELVKDGKLVNFKEWKKDNL